MIGKMEESLACFGFRPVVASDGLPHWIGRGLIRVWPESLGECDYALAYPYPSGFALEYHDIVYQGDRSDTQRFATLAELVDACQRGHYSRV